MQSFSTTSESVPRRTVTASSDTSSAATTGRGYSSPLQRDIRRDMQKDVEANRLAARSLIESPIGSITPETWLEANHLIQWWSIQRTVESVTTSFQLLQRILQERLDQPSFLALDATNAWLDTELLNRMLNNWRVLWWEKSNKEQLAQYTPRRVWDIVERNYSDFGLPMNEKSFYLVLEAEHSHPSLDHHQSNNKHHDTPEMAQTILERSMELYEINGLKDCLPSSDLCNLVMRIWNQSGRIGEAPTRCETIYNLMIRHDIPVTTRTYRAILNAWARIGTQEGVRRTHEWLYQMHAKYLEGNDSLQPDSAAIATVIAAWSRSKAGDAGRQALELYQHLGDLVQYNKIHVFNSLLTCFSKSRRIQDVQQAEQLFDELLIHDGAKDDSGKPLPNATTYLILMTAFAKVGRPDKAEQLLQRLQDGFAGGQENLKPSNSHFTSVISSYAQSNRKDKVEKMRSLMDRMEELSRISDDESLMPSLTTYNAFLACYAHGKLPFAGSEAEKVLHELKARADGGDARYTPDRITYSTVINVYAKIGLSEHAVRVLEDMNRDYESGNATARPDLQAYNTVLASFAKDKRARNASEQAVRFFERMKTLGESGATDKPDLVSYSALISAFANSKGGDKVENAQRAESVLRDLQSAYERGALSLRPNQIVYNGCINAWAVAGSFDRAGELLREMYLDFQSGNLNACPDVTSFNTLLKAFSVAKRSDAGEKAEEIVRRMKDLYQSGALSVRPNVVTYSTLILCHVVSKRPGSLDRAEEILRLIDRLHKEGELDQRAPKQTYDTLRRARAASPSSQRHERSIAGNSHPEVKARFPPRSSSTVDGPGRTHKLPGGRSADPAAIL